MKFNDRLKPNTEFIVYKSFRLSEDQYDILSMIYLPLIGPTTFSIYMYLHQSTRQTEPLDIRFHREFMDELSMTLTDFEGGLDKLEAIGLLRTYVSNEAHSDRFIYRLQQPLTAEDFFKDPMLSMYLYSQVGSEKYNNKKKELTYPSLPNDHTEVTKKFTDVFHHTSQEGFTVSNENFKQNDKSRGPTIDLDDFDFEVLFTHLKGTRIDKQFFSKDVKKLIVQLSQLFNLNAYDLKQILLQSTSPQFGIDQEQLKREARKYYQKEYGRVVPTFKTSTDDQAEDENLGYLESLDKVSPLDRINDLRNYKPSENDLKVVTEVITKTGLENGVINMLLEYTIQMKDEDLPLRYVMTIAENWEKEGYRTAAEAYKSIMDFREAKVQEQSKFKKQRYAQGETDPSWLKEKKEKTKRKPETKKSDEPPKTLKDDKSFSDLIKKFREN